MIWPMKNSTTVCPMQLQLKSSLLSLDIVWVFYTFKHKIIYWHEILQDQTIYIADPNATGFGDIREFETAGLWSMCALYHSYSFILFYAFYFWEEISLIIVEILCLYMECHIYEIVRFQFVRDNDAILCFGILLYWKFPRPCPWNARRA